MLSYSEGNPYPVEVSSISALDTRKGTNGPQRNTRTPPRFQTETLAELASLLADQSVRAWTLAPTGQTNEAIQIGSGRPDVLARKAHLASGSSSWAVVVRPSPAVLALDIDDCAALVLPALLRAAEDTSTTVLACVASGRRDCAHLWLAPATRHGREALCRAVRVLAELHDLPSGAIDDRTGKSIRLPGSVSLKPGGHHAQLIDPETGAPADPAAVLALAHATIPSPTVRRPPATRQRPRPRPTPVTALPLSVDTGAQLVTDAPRAWRRRTTFSTDEWDVLTDTRTRDRSAAATAAAWVLWRHGIRSAAAALWWYQRCAAFTKFRHRDEESRKPGLASNWSACRHHWASIVSRARSHRPNVSEADRQILAAAREEIRWWADPDLQAAAAVLIDRFDDGHGLTDRPIARRDLQLALHLSDGVASQRIAALVSRGLIQVRSAWTPTAPREATRYDLTVPSHVYRGKSAHDITTPLTILRHALWGLLRHGCRRALLTLERHPSSTTRTLATLLALPVGDASHGTLHLLRQLEHAGLASRSGTGRGTTWSLSLTADLDAAARLTGADLRAQELAARICGERACWHAESHAESARSLRGLHVLRARLTHSDAAGRRPRSAARTPPSSRTRRPAPGVRRAAVRSRAVDSTDASHQAATSRPHRAPTDPSSDLQTGQTRRSLR